MKTTRSVMTVVVLGALASFNSGAGGAETVKWSQMPDLSEWGLDVSIEMVAAGDDFLCEATGLITDIHIWGSWRSDMLPGGDVGNVGFSLSIYGDIPDPDGAGPLFSTPDLNRLVWSEYFGPGQFAVSDPIAAQEGWYDPFFQPDTFDYNNHAHAYRYDFFPTIPFEQQVGTTYWLVAHAQPYGGPGWFGWKTSAEHWNDDAVWYEPAAVFPEFHELRYPGSDPGETPIVYHPNAGQSIDLAFEITTTVIPAPGAMMLGGIGLGLVGWMRRRRLV